MKKFYAIILFFLITSCASIGQQTGFRIKNTRNESLYVKVEGRKNAPCKKLAFIQHGLASDLEHQAVQAVKKAFLDNNYTVVTFDSRHSLGNSGNDVPKARLSTFKEDLETVISWAQKQPFYSEPFALSGHSLGGASVLQYSAEHPESVNLLVPVAPVISGELWEKSCMKNMAAFCRSWKQNGFYKYTDKKNNKTAVIPYAAVTDSKSYNVYTLAPEIRARTLAVSAQNDNIIAPDDVKKLIRLLKNGSRSAVIKNSGHNFEAKQNLNDLYQTVSEFLK